MTAPLLQLDRLGVSIRTGRHVTPIVEDVSFVLGPGECLGIVGESGSGKSMTARAILRLLPPHAQVAGDVRFAGESIPAMSPARLREFRHRDVGMIFQDPRAHVNPVRTVGDFVTEALVTNDGLGRDDARRRAIALLDDVGVSYPERRMDQYPHELSGGMLQRAVIAAALATEPRLLLADEPTTALDVSTQSEVMAILSTLRRGRNLAMIFITHDLDLAAAVCDRIAVLYAGNLLEIGDARQVHDRPTHPYSAALVACKPSISRRVERLNTVSGVPIALAQAPGGCVFAPRCAHRIDRCDDARPALAAKANADGLAACHRLDELDPVAVSTEPGA